MSALVSALRFGEFYPLSAGNSMNWQNFSAEVMGFDRRCKQE
jgi:hypothetical protein